MAPPPALLLALLLAAPGQTGAAPAPPFAEGELRNDAFLPVSDAAARALAAGDAALTEARRGLPKDAPLRLAAALEAWREALAASATGDSVPVPPDVPAVEARVTEGVENAVLRRVAALAPEERAAWRARFDALAEAELAAARHGGSAAAPEARAALAALERGLPATPAAARAALFLSDLAREAGRPLVARTFAARARRHLEVGGVADAALAAGAAARLAAAAEPPPAGETGWRAAPGLALLGTASWEGSAVDPGRALAAPEPGEGVRAGAVLLGPGRAAVQLPDGLVLVALPAPDGRGGVEVERIVRLDEVLGELPRAELPARALRAPGPPGWPLLPAVAGGDLVLVHGRAGRRDALLPNALLALRPPAPGARPPLPLGAAGAVPALGGEALPELRWGWLGAERLGPGGRPLGPDPTLAALAPAAAEAALEWQPGPVVRDGLVLAQLRTLGPSGTRAHLVALDAASGEVRWARTLAQGSDLAPRPVTHLEAGPVAALAAQPVAAVDGLAFAGTHLGAGALVAAADGRLLWTLRSRRRDPLEPGWAGGRPPVTPGGPEGPAALLFAPADSDRLYLLRAEPLAAGDWTTLLAAPPLPLGEAEVLVGGSPAEVLVLGRAGAERTLTALGPRSGARTDALRLGVEDRFRGTGLLSAARVVVPTGRGAWLFDRGRELALLDHEPPPPALPEGGLFVPAGPLVLVVGPRALAVYGAAGEAGPGAEGGRDGGR